MKTPQNTLKYLIGLSTVIILRLLPHPPNVEPIMSTMMPFSKKWGWLSGMAFGFMAIFSFDIITGTLGVWSLVTATTYALIGVFAGLYLKNKENKIKYYVGFSIVATIVYDAITGIGIGMAFFDQSFMATFTGQIPFTMYHLLGNIVLSCTLSPLLYKWIIANPKLETTQVLNKIAFGVK